MMTMFGLYLFNLIVRSQCCDRTTGNEEICEIAALLSSYWSETILASDWLEHHPDWKIFHASAPLCVGFQVTVYQSSVIYISIFKGLSQIKT